MIGGEGGWGVQGVRLKTTLKGTNLKRRRGKLIVKGLTPNAAINRIWNNVGHKKKKKKKRKKKKKIPYEGQGGRANGRHSLYLQGGI